jgi:hypothetical protein
MVHGTGLEPGAGVSEFVRDHSHTIEVGVIVVYLVKWVSPSISNSYSLQVDSILSDKTVVVY